MSNISQKITPFLWFNTEAEDAVNFYTSVFKNARIANVTRYDEAGAGASGREVGSVMTIDFQLEGQNFVALNGGPEFKFNESISFVVNCETQEEIDYYWERLSEGGPVDAQQCGWLKDKFGLSWQVVPAHLNDLMKNPETAQQVMQAILSMKKIDLNVLQQAAAGQHVSA